jgi:hypothetical protein
MGGGGGYRERKVYTYNSSLRCEGVCAIGASPFYGQGLAGWAYMRVIPFSLSLNVGKTNRGTNASILITTQRVLADKVVVENLSGAPGTQQP